MLSAVVLTLSLASVDPQIALLVGRRTSVTQADAQLLSQKISTQLSAAGVPLKLDADAARANLSRLGLKDASACNGRKACVTELGRQLGVTLVMVLSLSQVGNDRSIALELLRVEDGMVLEKEALILPTGTDVKDEELSAFFGRVRKQVVVEDRPVVEAPVKVSEPVLPVLPPTPLVIAPAAPAPPKSHVGSFVLGGVAVAALAVATGLLVSGLNTRADAYRTTEIDGTLRSPYAASEVQRRAAGGSVALGIAGGAAALGLGLGTAAVITW